MAEGIEEEQSECCFPWSPVGVTSSIIIGVSNRILLQAETKKILCREAASVMIVNKLFELQKSELLLAQCKSFFSLFDWVRSRTIRYFIVQYAPVTISQFYFEA